MRVVYIFRKYKIKLIQTKYKVFKGVFLIGTKDNLDDAYEFLHKHRKGIK